MIFVINVFRHQGCPHLGQGHGPIVSSRHLRRRKRMHGHVSGSFTGGSREDFKGGDKHI